MTQTWEGKPLAISNSEIQTWKRCHRKWWLTYYRELGLRRNAESAVGVRELGTRIHVALDAMYAKGDNPIGVVDELYLEDLEKFPEKVDELKKERELCHAMLEGYVDWIRETGADEGLTLIATETVLEVPSGIENVTLRGKLDQRVQRKIDGAHLFIDHKTVGSVTEPLKTLGLDEQTPFYSLLERLHAIHTTGGHQQVTTDGGIYNMLRRVKRTATATPPFYDRIEVRFNEAELTSAWIRVHAVIEDILDARRQLDIGADPRYVAYRRMTRDCSWDCDFLPVCIMFDDGSNVEGALGMHYTHVDPHERYQAIDEGREVTQ